MRRLLVCVALFGLVATPAMGDPVIYDNGSADANSNGLSSQWDTAYPFDSQVADDFVLEEDANIITDLHWSGVFWNGSEDLGTDDFNILIYDDAGGMPTGGPADPTVTAIKVWTLTATATAAPDLGTFAWRYDADMSADPLTLTPGVTYWLAIQNISDYPPQWGWHTAVAGSGGGSGAHQGFPLLGMDYWTVVDPAVEMAFQLTGVPEPASLALLGIGALALIRRR